MRSTARPFLLPIAAFAATLCLAAPAAKAVPTSVLASVGMNGAPGNLRSGSPAVSANGRYVAFLSDATGLVGTDTNGATDVFLRDLQNGTSMLLSLAGVGPSNGGMDDWDPPALSADGRYVAFASSATNLVAGDANGVQDLFLRDVQSSTTERLSLGNGGAEADGPSFTPSLSADGRYVAFASLTSNLGGRADGDVYVRDRSTGVTSRAALAPDGGTGNGPSGYPALSADGRYLAFISSASNLVDGDTNETADVFMRDLLAGTTTLVSVAADGTPANDWSDFAPSVSADGRFVAFVSNASNLVPGDTNGAPDVFVRDTLAGATYRISVATDGTEANDASWAPSISADGHYVAFVSDASNLTSGDTNGAADVFIRDLWTGRTAIASVTPTNYPTDGPSGSFYAPSLSGDGAVVAFESWASTITSGDTNGLGDAFARSPLFMRTYFLGDILEALRDAGGIHPVQGYNMTRLNTVTTGPSAGVVDISDAARIARRAAGLEP